MQLIDKKWKWSWKNQLRRSAKNENLYFTVKIYGSLINKLDGKYAEKVQLPAYAKFGGFCRQHLATLATRTIIVEI